MDQKPDSTSLHRSLNRKNFDSASLFLHLSASYILMVNTRTQLLIFDYCYLLVSLKEKKIFYALPYNYSLILIRTNRAWLEGTKGSIESHLWMAKSRSSSSGYRRLFRIGMDSPNTLRYKKKKNNNNNNKISQTTDVSLFILWICLQFHVLTGWNSTDEKRLTR